MKLRVWSGLLAVLLLLMLVSAAALSASAAPPTTGDIWMVYTLTENDKGMPTYGITPEHRYTDEGLLVRPLVSADFTVQSDHAYSVDDGLFLEIRVDDTETFRDHNQLVFHLWSQTGVIMNHDRAGSGFYALISPMGGEHYLICMGIKEQKGDAESESVLFGALKLQPRYTEDGKLLYTLAVRNGVFYVNGQKLDMSAKILSYLDYVNPNAGVHIGATVCCREGEPSTSITVTRFGLQESTAAVPSVSTAPDVPPSETETKLPSETETKVPDESDTMSPTESDTQIPSENETSAPSETDTQSPMETEPDVDTEETRAPDGEATGEPPAVTDPAVTDPAETPTQSPGETLPSDGEPTETTEEDAEDLGGMAQGVVDIFEKISPFKSCSASLSAGGLIAFTALLSAAVLILKKRD
jgi:hypothetical protein